MNQFSLLVALPLLGAFLLPVIGRIANWLAQIIAPFIVTFLLGLSLSAWIALGNHSLAIQMGNFAAPLGITFYIDGLSLLFCVLISIMFLMIWPWQDMGETQNDSIPKLSLYLLLLAASYGMVLSGDLFNIYVFYELLAVATYGLVARSKHPAAHAASLRYVLISASGSALMLIGITIVYTLSGSLNIAHLAQLSDEKLHHFSGVAGFLLIVIGLGVKAEMFAVNTWVAEVYGISSARLAALLAGLISKIAVLAILRLLVLVFPLEPVYLFLLTVGMLAVISAELIAWRSQDLVRMMSFSSIAQLGMIFVALAIPGEYGVMIALALMLHHWLVKSALFFYTDTVKGNYQRLRGWYQRAPLQCWLFILLALSLLGIPPLPGFWIKLWLISHLFAQHAALYTTAAVLIMLASVIEGAYLFRLARLWFKRADENSAATLPTGYLYRLIQLMVVVLLASVYFMPSLERQLHQLGVVTTSRAQYINTVLRQSAHPVAASSATTSALAKLSLAQKSQSSMLPVKDGVKP